MVLPPVYCASCPIFSSRVICARSASTRAFSFLSASGALACGVAGGGGSGVALCLRVRPANAGIEQSSSARVVEATEQRSEWFNRHFSSAGGANRNPTSAHGFALVQLRHFGPCFSGVPGA